MEGKPDTAVKSGMTKAKDAFINWGIPLVLLAVGYYAGDTLGVADKLKELDKDNALNEAIPVKNPYGLIAAFIFFGVGAGVWSLVGGWIGKAIGFFCCGVGIALLLDSV